MADKQEQIYINNYRDVEITGKSIPLSSGPVPSEDLNRERPGVFYENDLGSPTTHFRNMLRTDFQMKKDFVCIVQPNGSVLYSDSPLVTHFELDAAYASDGSARGFYNPAAANPTILDVFILNPNATDVQKVKNFFLSVFPEDIHGGQLRIYWAEGNTEFTGTKKY